MTPTPIDARSLTEQVVEALQARVRAGEFADAGKLPTEAELVAAYGVSRTVVREAISQLRARGVVQTRRGIGTFARDAGTGGYPLPSVDPGTLAEVIALLELRISVETEAAALAANRASEERVARLESLVRTLEAAAEHDGDAADADFEFHLTIAEATGNRYFADLLRQLGRAIIPRTRLDSPAAAHQDRRAYLQRVNDEHRVIYRAIARRDPDAARAAMRTHLANSRERLRQLQDESDGA